MNTLFLFKKTFWNKKTIEVLLANIGEKYSIRYGFSYLLAVFDSKVSLDELSVLHSVFVIRYDSTQSTAEKEAYILDRSGSHSTSLNTLLEEESNLAFDIQNFGLLLYGGIRLEDLYSAVKNSHLSNELDEVLQLVDIYDLIHSPNLSAPIKKLLLDIYTLEATGLYVTVKLHKNGHLVSNYSQIFMLSFVVRAKFEKLMLLLAIDDPALDYQQLDRSRKMKATFKKLASKSNFAVTKEMALILEDLEILDDNYRTPETHKMGRNLGLIHAGYYSTLMNEVLSFENKSREFFINVCNRLREQESHQV